MLQQQQAVAYAAPVVSLGYSGKHAAMYEQLGIEAA